MIKRNLLRETFILPINETATNTNISATKEEEFKMMDKFNRSNTPETDITINKVEVMLDRYRELRGTEVERLLRTFASIMAESDRHMDAGDQYFEYKRDKIDAKVRVDMIISMIYKKEGNLNEIMDSICFRNAKAEAMELSDHYWAVPRNI